MPTKKKTAPVEEATPTRRPGTTVARDAQVLHHIEVKGACVMRDILDLLELEYKHYALAYNSVRRLEADGKLVKIRDGSRTPLWGTPTQAKAAAVSAAPAAS